MVVLFVFGLTYKVYIFVLVVSGVFGLVFLILEWVFVVGVFARIGGLAISKDNWLRVLLLLEVGALRLFVGRVVGFGFLGGFEVRLAIMSISACEVAVGLGMLITYARVKGNDFTEVRLFIK